MHKINLLKLLITFGSIAAIIFVPLIVGYIAISVKSPLILDGTEMASSIDKWLMGMWHLIIGISSIGIFGVLFYAWTQWVID